MQNKLLLRTALVFCAGVFQTSACFAQKIPVVIYNDGMSADDEVGLRFKQSLSDEVQISGKFYLLNETATLPPDGVLITVISLMIRNASSHRYTGSAICGYAFIQSAKDPGYFKMVSREMYFIPHDQSVADDTRGFLAEVDRRLGR